MVRRSLPRSEGVAEFAHRSHRRAAGGVQYGSLQRKNSGAQRDFGRDARSFGSDGAYFANEGRRSGGSRQAECDSEVRFDERNSAASAAENGEAGRGGRRLDEGYGRED